MKGQRQISGGDLGRGWLRIGRDLAEGLERDEDSSWGGVWHWLVGGSFEAVRVTRNQGNRRRGVGGVVSLGLFLAVV